jgi:hypothetical protein
VTDFPDDRSAIARAVQLASSVTTVSLEMVLPVLVGHWIDRWLGVNAVFAILGGTVGLTAGIWSLVRMTQPQRGNFDDRLPPDPLQKH